MNYIKYIQSAEWFEKRDSRLRYDDSKCRTCGSRVNLEVHHITYERLGDELLEDLITLCKECHQAITSVIRRRRYNDQPVTVIPIKKEMVVNYEENESKTKWDCTFDYEQWTSR